MDPIDVGRGRVTGWCSHPSIGRVTQGEDHCVWYTRGNTRGPSFHMGAAEDAFIDFRQGLIPDKREFQKGPPLAPLDELRRRSARGRGRP